MTVLKNVRNIFVGLLFITLQIIIFRHLSFYEIQPDIVLVFLIWAMTRCNRTTAILLAGVTGIFQDALLDLWGLNLFTKTLSTFTFYNFVPKIEHTRPNLTQVFVVVLIYALVNNFIFLNLGGLLEAYTTQIYFWRHWIGNSIYTAIMGIFIYFFYTDR